jgi:NAD(P)-dependent dehydrogenase (short-subunit alcohol dehydrogenase family)
MTLNMEGLFLSELISKVVIVTGGANGIGAETVRTLHAYGAQVVIADLENQRGAAEKLRVSLDTPLRTLFHPVDVTDWESMKVLFKSSLEKFGAVHVVVTCAGVMETRDFFATTRPSDQKLQIGVEPEEPVEALRVIDINLKGSMIGEQKPVVPQISISSRPEIVLST